VYIRLVSSRAVKIRYKQRYFRAVGYSENAEVGTGDAAGGREGGREGGKEGGREDGVHGNLSERAIEKEAKGKESDRDEEAICVGPWEGR
jgi:hypothetical protein